MEALFAAQDAALFPIGKTLDCILRVRCTAARKNNKALVQIGR
jgi:hypothetical protein